ncbi:TlpA family protein disulfide reductase [Enterovibrio sp. ZSDZ35]|uniref:TlpA family protein disulfide reductase n=1 Tax=Enterovibrio qingdaonensis TaxID=2899818 RepID=A0ABT5QFJ2_9GAMM|nr:TlpA disulfide reductase family protein [Enterovibrio sp. ZSDZ35]MDD1779750.1 TlpA family protein disulfide reductase [Enterovibrio sp. ZSDZ35]
MLNNIPGRQFNLNVSHWFNTEKEHQISDFEGKVVVIYVFQMLCPGCISHGLPLAKNIQQSFRADDVQVIGLHSVFEHHDVMTPKALQAFIHEYRLTFPVAVDKPSQHSHLPETMKAYQFGGTPTILVIDQHGRLRLNHFGTINELQLGAIIGSLLEENEPLQRNENNSIEDTSQSGCDENGCSI